MHHGRHNINERILAGIIVLCCLLLYRVAQAGGPVITQQRVTDVATRSFSALLTVSEPADTTIALFAADCSTPVTGFTTALQQNTSSGNVRLTVSTLKAATTYCYQLAVTSKATSEQTISAASAVTTATAIVRTASLGPDLVPGGNDILKVPAVHLPPGTPRDGIVTTLEFLDGLAMAPLSLLLTATANKDYFNLNNVFTAANGNTHLLAGGERVKITELHGSGGCVISRFRTISAVSGGTAPRAFVQADANDIDASGGVNVLDILRVVGGKGAVRAGECFNSDLDLNGDGVVDGADLAILKGGFNGLP